VKWNGSKEGSREAPLRRDRPLCQAWLREAIPQQNGQGDRPAPPRCAAQEVAGEARPALLAAALTACPPRVAVASCLEAFCPCVAGKGRDAAPMGLEPYSPSVRRLERAQIPASPARLRPRALSRPEAAVGEGGLRRFSVQRLAVSSSSAASDDPEPGAGPSLLTARGSRRQAQHHRSRCAADEVRPGLSGFSLVIAFKARRSLAPSLAPNHAKRVVSGSRSR
jgi:hypothetical protein